MMETSVTTGQAQALMEELQSGPPVSGAALAALRRAQQLEQEVLDLRQALAALPAGAAAQRGPEWRAQAALLLSKVILLRAALAQGQAASN